MILSEFWVFRARNISILVIAIILGCANSLLAQDTGSIEGTVFDSETGEAMIGVSIMVEGTSRGAASDLDGHYRISEVPIGKQTIIATMIGYSRVTIRDVLVDINASTKINIQMASEAVELGEVVIEAKMVNNTEASLLGIRKRAPIVADGISAEQIKKSPDSDAGEAMKRITGVTVVGDKYVFVRGMGERYNNTRLNGATIASPEPLKRVVPFDVIPASLLDNIIVSKTFTPDQPGDFAGGSVQLSTQEFPEKLTFSVNSSSSYNSQSSMKEFLTYRGGDRDWIGMDDGSREIPDRVWVASNDPNQVWQLDTLLPKELAKSFKNTWEPRRISAPLSGSKSLAIGNQSEVFGKPVGYLLTATYSESFSSREERQYGYSPVSRSTQKYQDFVVNRSNHSVNWGGILDLNTKLSQNHKLSLKSLYTRSADDVVRINEGLTKEEYFVRSYRLSWTERSLFSSQMKGAHELPKVMNSRLDWFGNYSRATWEEPDRRDVDYFHTGSGIWEHFPGKSPAFRRFAEMEDNIYEGSLDWSVPLKFMKDPSSKLKIGGMARTMDRTFPTRKYLFKYVADASQPVPNFSLPPEVIFAPDYIDRYFDLEEVSLRLDSYDADMKVMAGYIMGDILLGKKWRVVGGVRVEDTDQHFSTFAVPGSQDDGSDKIEGGPKHTDVLPALNITYKLNDQMNLRAAGSMTIANPDYAEIVPTEDQDYFEGLSKRGNPDSLNHSKIYNADLRWEYYPTPGENIAFGMFFKHVVDPIEATWINYSTFATVMPQNFADANNMGFEFEYRKLLPYLAPYEGHWLSYFSSTGNFAVISSQVDASDYWLETGSGLLTTQKRPMVGQSEYMINFTLSWDHPGWGSGVRVLFNTFGRRISQLGTFGLEDTYEEPFDKLDAIYDQKVGQHWSFKLKATNLLNSEVKFMVGDLPFQTYKIGRTVSAGLSYSL